MSDTALMSSKPRPAVKPPSTERDAFWIDAFAPKQRARPGGGGKWLVFVPQSVVDSWWDTIKTAIEAGRLGNAAKVATARASPLATSKGSRVICIYTEDWRDKADVRRVLGELRTLGLEGRLSYKRDEDTMSGRYGSGAATYVSQPGSLDFEDRT
jgi:hypothetical protein